MSSRKPQRERRFYRQHQNKSDLVARWPGSGTPAYRMCRMLIECHRCTYYMHY